MGLNFPLAALGVLTAGLAIAVIVLSVELANANKELSAFEELSSTAKPIESATTKTTTTTRKPTNPWEIDYRLPDDSLPLHYEIYLHPDLTEATFNGTVDIHINLIQSRSFLLVHTKYLQITSTKLLRGIEASADEVQIDDTFEYTPNEFWVIKLSSVLQPGLYMLTMHFRGSLVQDVVGFFKSDYFNFDSNTTRSIASSKFEPTYARRAFPCMDEPSFKSTFGVTLVRPTEDSYVAYSNMPEKGFLDNVPIQGLTTVSFDTSVPMVTYLACFIVCDFKERLGYTKRGLPVRSIARPNQYDSTEYPLKIGILVTEYYEEYFGIEYALPKLDLIAVPDFVSEAMEHWGLVTFRETSFLFDSFKGSTPSQKRAATVIVHELAHQWFGNLMTVIWWDDLWLNEGFASFMEFKATDYCEPTWDMMNQILSDNVGPVFEIDSKLSSHPIVQPVNHPDEITELFDGITYAKGASVITMLESFIGPDKFQEGIHNFLRKYEFSNAATSDLWTELEAVTDLNIARIMDTWTLQMGFPVITYSVEDGLLYVLQTRFLSNPDSNETVTPSPYGYKWDVPIFYITDKSPSPQFVWLKMDYDFNCKWIKLNANQRGFYRVNYKPEHWNAFVTTLNENVSALQASDRWGLIDDSFSLSAAGSLSYNTALGLVQYIKNDRHPVPWNAASGKLLSISGLIYNTDLYSGFRDFIIDLVTPAYLELGWNDEIETFLDRNLQNIILSLACTSCYTPCLEVAAELLQKWINSNEFIPPDFQRLVYRFGIFQIDDSTVWDAMWNRYTFETDPNVASDLLYGLAFAKEPWLIYKYLELAKTDQVKSQDYLVVLENISHNPVGLPIVWDFVRNEWDYLVDRFSTNNRNLGRVVGTVTSQFTTQIRLDEVKDFFAKNPDAGAGARAREQALETVQNNIKWLNVNKNEIETWLIENGFM